ncbi:MAG TPA: hypothetical protein VFT74_13705, partial [Isosphaeraceae bacterium]|nr:hypothetical protein [Isosphaeraceae bacterium]
AAAGLDLDALRSRGFSVETVDDPALAGWLFGAKWARSGQAGATRFVLVSPEESGEHGFLFRPGAERILSDANPRPPADVLLLLNEAGSISLKRPEPGKIAVGPVSLEPQSLVVLPVQYDSQWRGVWTRDSEQIEAKPLRAFPNGAGGGWLGARSPGPGRWMLSWDYEPASERLGQWVALPAWLVWGLALAATFRGRAVRNETSSTETIPQEGRET